MRIAIFTDVDRVLTKNAINYNLGVELGVKKEITKLEQEFASRYMRNEEFNDVLIPLFASKGFTERFMDDFFEKIELRYQTDNFFKLNGHRYVDIFFVSSGPSYYIDKLAKKYEIPQERVLCSRYEFDPDTELISKCLSPQSKMTKSRFVKEHVDKYDISIGIGDNIENDSPFLADCEIAILIGNLVDDYICVDDLFPVINLVKNLLDSSHDLEIHDPSHICYFGPSEKCRKGIKKLIAQSAYEKNVFIITPFLDDPEFKAHLDIIKQVLEENDLNGYIAETQLENSLWLNVQSYMLGCKYGIAIFPYEEDVDNGGDERRTFNANVSIELGYMMGRGKNVLLLKDKRIPGLSTDLVGTLYHEFDLEDDQLVRDEIQRWLRDVVKNEPT